MMIHETNKSASLDCIIDLDMKNTLQKGEKK